ncbi:hypothetical protein N7457_009430 [Penicillium paradoxum]|uniref:uncharacterized protein n=1 Tax=Penicillium paradoxum TaxID=176176 RepID=UPI002547F1E3|nr:uncharacterized protein N7457_009430 [Penicillium paradoxum]KAJ5774534.1 hypothetical protein N7457_009430 [Penicillium paradoxum]
MIPEALQPKALLAHPRTLAPHLRTLIVADASTENLDFISSCILDQVQTEAIPSSVFNIWLSLTCKHSWYFPVKALHDPSYGVRAGATKVVKHRLFRGSHWKERGWDVLGGAQGTKDILDKLPLVEVPRLVDAIFGRCDGFSDRKLVSTCIEEFLTLMEDTNRWVSRSLLPHLTFLYALCSAEKVEHLLRSQSRISFKIRSHVPRFHTHLLRLIGVGAVHMPNEVRLGIIKRYRSSLLSSKEPYDPIYYQKRAFDMSPGLLFGMDLLMAMEKEPEQHSNDEIDQWVEEILDKMIREKLPVESILLILNQGSAVCQASALARPKDSVGWLSRGLSQFVIQLWSISRFGRVGGSLSGLMAKYRQRRRTKPLSGHQASLEQCLIQKILHVNDESFSIQQGRPRFTRTIINLLSLVDKQGRMEFLQLLFQHSPSLQIDLTAWPPSKKEEEVMPCWDIDVLRILPPEDSKSLFRRSLHIHHCEEFLPSSQGKDSGSKIPSWEAQCRLWATWESVGSQGDDFPVTRKGTQNLALL